MGPLYFKRWPIEIHYKADKYIEQIENFSGITPRVIAQDYHATILFSNLAGATRQAAQAAWDAVRDQTQRKYDQYRINFNLVVGSLKNKAIAIFLHGDPRRLSSRYKQLVNQLMHYVEPVIPGRKFARHKRRRNTKYPVNLRRSL